MKGSKGCVQAYDGLASHRDFTLHAIIPACCSASSLNIHLAKGPLSPPHHAPIGEEGRKDDPTRLFLLLLCLDTYLLLCFAASLLPRAIYLSGPGFLDKVNCLLLLLAINHDLSQR